MDYYSSNKNTSVYMFRPPLKCVHKTLLTKFCVVSILLYREQVIVMFLKSSRLNWTCRSTETFCIGREIFLTPTRNFIRVCL